MTQPLSTSHSAYVEAWLDCGKYGRVMLSRVTPRSVVAKAIHEIPPCDADLVVMVDGHRVSNRVNLPTGFTKGRRVAGTVLARRLTAAKDAAAFYQNMSLETEILSQFKTLLRGAKPSVRERQLLAEIAADSAVMYANAASGKWDAAKVAREKAQLDAQLAGLKSIGVARASKLFWKAFGIAVKIVTAAIVSA